MSNYTSAAYVAHNRNLPERDMDGSYFQDEPTAEEIASYERWQANGGANYTPTAEDMEADDKAQNLADAIVRLMGLDTLSLTTSSIPKSAASTFWAMGMSLLWRSTAPPH